MVLQWCINVYIYFYLMSPLGVEKKMLQSLTLRVVSGCKLNFVDIWSKVKMLNIIYFLK